MPRIIVIGCPGSGKSTFSRKLREKLGLPLYHLDMIYHKPDKTTVTREEFDARLAEILAMDSWIIDGNYNRTLEPRLDVCDAVFLFDLPTEVCIEGALSRLGVAHDDLPWVETEPDEEFLEYIRSFRNDMLPRIYGLLEQYAGKDIVVFKSREDADKYINTLKAGI